LIKTINYFLKNIFFTSHNVLIILNINFINFIKRRRKNIELGIFYGSSDTLEVTRNRRLRWAGHARRSQNQLLHVVIEQNPVGKRLLGRQRMRWEDIIKKDVEQLGGISDRRNLALDIEGWKIVCET
jgi:hypothetical protein